jgi:hypothetical protein
MFAFADRLIRSGSDIRLFTHSLVAHLRSLFLVLHAPAAQEILDISDERLERLRAQANHLSSEEILRLLDLANEAQLQLREGIEGRLALEVALTRMARPDLHATPSSLLARLERLESLVTGRAQPPPVASAPVEALRHIDTPPATAGRPRLGPEGPAGDDPGDLIRPALAGVGRETATPPPVSVPAQAAPSQSAVAKHEGPVDIEKVQRAWPLILEEIKRHKISFRALLLAARPVEYRGGELVLEFGPRHRFHKDQVSKRGSQAPLIEAFEQILGERPTVRCILGEEELSASQAGPQSAGEPGGAGQSANVPSAGPAGSDSRDLGEESRAAPSPGVGGEKDQATAAIELIREAFAGAEVVDE